MSPSTDYVIYLAGPMTGYENFNYPAFNEAAKLLRSHDYTVINPAENFDGRTDLPRSTYIREAVKQVADADMLVLLPGWKNSAGAYLEFQIAIATDIVIANYEDLVRDLSV